MTATSIPALDEFLESWKSRAIAYYTKQNEKWWELYHARLNASDNGCGKRPGQEGYEAYEAACEALREFEKSMTNAEKDIVLHRIRYKDAFEKLMDKTVADKKAKLIARVEKKVGKLVDAALLSFGSNGELNGVVKGEKCNAYVETILAGGYNIQCLHYRVLVK